jgi:TatD DNase family protein
MSGERPWTGEEPSVTLSSIVSGPASLIDTHCHLDLPQFDVDRDAVIARAQAAGVGTIIVPGITLDSCRALLRPGGIVEQYPGIYAAVGVHPNDCAGFDDEAVTVLRDLSQHPRVVAIGEIGLDFYWQRVPHEQQKRALQAQLGLATESELPVILHSRQSIQDLLRELAQWVLTIRTDGADSATLGVLHAFSGELADAETAYDLGFVLGLGGPVTFRNAHKLHALVPQLRPDRLMLETDAPYLAPHPHRGQRNEPGYLPLIAQSLAALMAETPETLAAQTAGSARRCFGRIT